MRPEMPAPPGETGNAEGVKTSDGALAPRRVPRAPRRPLRLIHLMALVAAARSDCSSRPSEPHETDQARVLRMGFAGFTRVQDHASADLLDADRRAVRGDCCHPNSFPSRASQPLVRDRGGLRGSGGDFPPLRSEPQFGVDHMVSPRYLGLPGCRGSYFFDPCRGNSRLIPWPAPPLPQSPFG